ncbi:hypothetical protein PR202_ga10940 [Eleusine coracana subsp. coracana]|uniref:DUF6598 domain-containing protein n=1 Tax=Eleusine coracana subsp. coracana TaxID=191504 RepID=A0AAV5C7V4_ELECO|nr:hypothetical protein PR202_ga10940 [Eleusine coracana subsp. coracana]
MSEAERAEEAERLRQEAMEDARRLLEVEGDHQGSLMKQCRARVIDLDPKQGGVYFNRMSSYSSLPEFDLDEESPFGPMRFTYTVYENGDTPEVCEAVNILSVKISCLDDVAFPIQVYGSVIARDSIDHNVIPLSKWSVHYLSALKLF